MRSGSLPAKADVHAQQIFYDERLKPLMDSARDIAQNVQLLFLDASHFVMGCDFLGAIWSRVRRLVTTFSGRKRYNVLGALNFVTKEVHTVTNDGYITATEICELFRKLAQQYPNSAIHLILDNARYQKCKIVKELAEELGIVLNYIPPYSPNLNIIERLWKFVKGELRSQFYDDFEVFKSRIDTIINSTAKENKSILDSLIGEKVQLFVDLQPVAQNTYEKAEKLAA